MLRNSAQEWILRCIGHNGSIFSNNKIRKAKTKFLKCRCWYRCHFLCWCRDIDNNTTQKKFSIKDFFRNSWCSARFPLVLYYWRFLVYFISIERGEIPLVELKYFFIKRNVDLIEIWQMVVWCWKILAEEIFLRGEHLKSCGTKMAVKEWL